MTKRPFWKRFFQRYSAEQTRSNSIHLRAFFETVWQHSLKHPKLSITVFVTRIIVLSQAAYFPKLYEKILDGVLLDSADFSETLSLLGLLLIGILVIAIAGSISSRNLTILMQKSIKLIRQDLFKSIQKLPPKRYSRYSTADLMSHLTNDINTVESAFIVALPGAFSLIIIVSIVTVMMVYTQWLMALIIVVLTPVIFLVIRAIQPKLNQAIQDRKGAESALANFTQDYLSQHMNIFLLGLTQHETKSFNQKVNRLEDHSLATLFFSNITQLFTNFYLQGMILGVLSLGLFFHSKALITIGELVAFCTLFIYYAFSIQTQTPLIPNIFLAAASMAKIQAIMDDAPTATRSRTPLPALSSGITFNQVYFQHDLDATPLQDISFQIKPGQSLGIIGPSGSGKSTLVQLLLNTQTPEKGQIHYNDHCYSTLAPRQIQTHIKAVLQTFPFFNGSILDNIQLSNPDISRAKIQSLCQKIGLMGLLKRQGHTLDFPLSYDGHHLSYEERALICLARVLVAEPEVLVLDETLAAMDLKFERHLSKYIQEQKVVRSLIVTSFRVQNVQNLDHIIVLNHGRIIEQGSHDELLANKGYYYQLSIKQSGFYVDEENDDATLIPVKLRSIPFLQDLDPALLHQIAPHFITDHFEPGECIVKEGDPGNKFYMIVRGKVQVEKMKGPRPNVVASLQDGDYFGEIALIQQVPRTSTVRALSACTCLSLASSQFQLLLQDSPNALKHLQQIAKQRLSEL